MKALYIGQYSSGTTSKMRADTLRKILATGTFDIIDTHIPFFSVSRIYRALGFRHKIGPLIKKTNAYILENIQPQYDLIWVDKGVYITPETTKKLRNAAGILVHFTPDMAFLENQSRHFYKSAAHYDYLITTKTAEKKFYKKLSPSNKLLLCTQGFDKTLHKNNTPFRRREDALVFIGLYEKHREEVIQELLQKGIRVYLAGKNWDSFTDKNRNNKALIFVGDQLFGQAYVDLLNKVKFGLGLLSKRFPELHTTRTFEIPACGTALITERNTETNSFFNEDEAIFYNDIEHLVSQISYYQNHSVELEDLAKKGTKRVLRDAHDYESIMHRILSQIGVI